MTKTKVAVCIVNWNGKKDSLELLESLKTLDTSSLETRIFFVDGGSTDGSVEAIKSLPVNRTTRLQLIEKTKNRGTAGGYNDGIRAGLAWGANYFLLINNDVLVGDKNLLHELIKTAESDPKIGIVSPVLYFAPGFEFHKEKYTQKDTGKVIWYAGGKFDWNNVFASHRGIDEVDTGKYHQAEETGLISGSCLLVKKAVFDQGIFWDEGLFAYFDDNDFQERVRRAGFKLYFDGQTNIFHKVSRTSGIASPVSDYYITRNRLIFGLRYAPLRTKIALLRQALSYLLVGRPAQKQGVIDFLTGHFGERKNP